MDIKSENLFFIIISPFLQQMRNNYLIFDFVQNAPQWKISQSLPIITGLPSATETICLVVRFILVPRLAVYTTIVHKF
jgi:hypothetical protein